eukprot:Rmarinus@m.23624
MATLSWSETVGVCGICTTNPVTGHVTYVCGDGIVEWDWEADLRRFIRVRANGAVCALAYSPDGLYMALAIEGAPSSLWIIDASDGALVQDGQLSGDFEAESLSFSRDGTMVAIVGTCSSGMRSYMVVSWISSIDVLFSFEDPSPEGSLCFLVGSGVRFLLLSKTAVTIYSDQPVVDFSPVSDILGNGKNLSGIHSPRLGKFSPSAKIDVPAGDCFVACDESRLTGLILLLTRDGWLFVSDMYGTVVNRTRLPTPQHATSLDNPRPRGVWGDGPRSAHPRNIADSTHANVFNNFPVGDRLSSFCCLVSVENARHAAGRIIVGTRGGTLLLVDETTLQGIMEVPYCTGVRYALIRSKHGRTASLAYMQHAAAGIGVPILTLRACPATVRSSQPGVSASTFSPIKKKRCFGDVISRCLVVRCCGWVRR